MQTKIILMTSCFVSSLIIDCIFITFDFTAIQRGVYFLLPTTVYKLIYTVPLITHYLIKVHGGEVMVTIAQINIFVNTFETISSCIKKRSQR